MRAADVEVLDMANPSAPQYGAMSKSIGQPIALSKVGARRIWLRAQQLDTSAPFGGGAEATRRAVEHLGYVQIDTINVIERCHHHILWTRIPGYRRAHLRQAQTVDKTVFEYWTHALSYVPTRDLHFFRAEMVRHRQAPKSWFSSVKQEDLRRVLRLVRQDGALTTVESLENLVKTNGMPTSSRQP